jgi:GAF domain-containing protein
MADRVPGEAKAEQRLSRMLGRVAWFRGHRGWVVFTCLALVVMVTIVDARSPSRWLLGEFYLIPLALLLIVVPRPRVIAAAGLGLAGLNVAIMIMNSDFTHSGDEHVSLIFFGFGVALIVGLAALLGQVDEVSLRALARAHFAEADAEIVTLSARQTGTDGLLDVGLERIVAELGAAAAGVLTLEDDEWVVLAGWGLPPGSRGVRMPKDALPVSVGLLEDGTTAIISSAREILETMDHPLARALIDSGVVLAMIVPMRTLRRSLGVLMLGFPAEKGALDAEETRFVTSVVGHLATTLENARLVSELATRERHLSLVLDSSLDFAATLDPAKVLGSVVERLVETLGSSGCEIQMVVEPGRTTIRTVVSFEEGRPDMAAEYVGKTYPVDAFASTAHVIATGSPLIASGLDDPHLSDLDRQWMREHGHAIQVGLPLMSRDRVIGVVELFDRSADRVFSGEEVELAEAMCRFAALALDNAQLYDRVERRNAALRELVEIGRGTATARDVDGMLRFVAKSLYETLDLCDCDIFTLRGDELYSAVCYDRNGYDEASVGHTLRVDEYGSSQSAIETQRPVLVRASDVPNLSARERGILETFGFVCSATIPMVVEGRVQGLIDVYDDRPRDFGVDLDFLASVGQLTAAALQKQLLLEEVTRRNVFLHELVELGAVVWRSRDIGALVRQVSQRLVKATGATCCEIFRLEEDGLRRAVSFHEREGFDDSGLGRPLRMLEYPATAMAIDRRETLVIADLDDERLSDKDRQVYARSGFRSELVVPLVVEDRVVGLLDLFDERPRDYADMLDFLITAGQMIAGAFDNMALLGRLDETNRELEALVDSGLEFGSTLDLDRVLLAIASRIREVADAKSCDIYAFERGMARGLVSVSADGATEDFAGSLWDASRYSVATMLDDRQPLIITDRDRSEIVTEFEREEWIQWGYRSALRLPLLSRDRLFGWIAIFDDHPREFEHLGLLRGLGQVAAQAVVNAGLYSELDESSRRLSLINEASLDLSSTLSLQTVLYATAERLCVVGDAPCCDIYSLQEGELVCLASVKDGAVAVGWVGHRVPLSEWTSDAQAVATRSTILLGGADDPQRSAAESASLEGTGLESQLTVPLLAADKVIGVVQLLDRRSGREFSPEMVATVEAICRAAALAIGNAELFDSERETSRSLERLAEQLQSLQEISLRLNRLRDERLVLNEVVRGGAALLNVDRAAYAVRDGEVVELKAFFSTASEWQYSEEEAEAAIETLWRVLPQLGDLEATPGVEVSVEQRAVLLDAALVVPLKRHRSDAIAALIFSDRRGGGGFDEEDKRLATTLAAQLSLTLRNVHAYQREHEIAEEFQNALLEPPPAVAGVEFGVRYVPAGQAARVGGDFYDFVRLGPRRFMIAVGDVCGRGLNAAVETAMVRYMLRAYAAESSPGESLARLNATISAQAPDLPFLTMLVAYVDVGRHTFDYAVAGHPRPVVLAAGERVAIAEEGGFPIGVFPNSVYATNRGVLPAGATVVLYTDGLSEARRGGVQIGEDRLIRLIERHLERSPQELADTLISRAQRFGGGNLDDDMAVVVMRLP